MAAGFGLRFVHGGPGGDGLCAAARGRGVRPGQDAPSAAGGAGGPEVVRPGRDVDARGLAVGGARDDLAVERPFDGLGAGADGDEAERSVLGQHGLEQERGGQEQGYRQAATTAKVVPYEPAASGVGTSARRSVTCIEAPGTRAGSAVSGPS